VAGQRRLVGLVGEPDLAVAVQVVDLSVRCWGLIQLKIVATCHSGYAEQRR
jgi:hypothetical protein